MSANLHGEWEAYRTFDRLGDPWAALNELVDFEAFRAILEDCWRPADEQPAKGGRPPYDAILMSGSVSGLAPYEGEHYL